MPWILLGVGILLLVLLLLVFYLKRGEKHVPDYRTFFILGITWFPLGFVLDNSFFWIAGLSFMSIGLANVKKWQKPKPWAELTKAERRSKKIVIFGLGLLVAVGLAAFLWVGFY